MDNTVSLKEATEVSVTTLVDNYIDIILRSEGNVKRGKLVKKKGKKRNFLLAEHGLSFLIEVFDNSFHHTIMMDFGLSNVALPNNIFALGIDLSTVETFVLSHGHFDHVGSIEEILGSVPAPADIIVHPDAFLEERLLIFPNNKEVSLPSFERKTVELLGANIIEVKMPMELADNYVATITEIPRVTDFEKGLPNAYFRKEGKVSEDKILDDQGLVINVKNKGLVIISGCSHAGIINTILYAQQITGVTDIYAVIGGFHLSGPQFEPIIGRTVEEMKKFSPKYLMPVHCTGWKAMSAFQEVFPEEFILTSVGTTVIL